MSFTHPFTLVLASIPLIWTAYSWSGSRARGRLLLKGFSLLAIVLAYSEPTLKIPETKAGVVLLTDISKSIGSRGTKQAASLITKIDGIKKNNWIQVIPFAGKSFTLASTDAGNALSLLHATAPTVDHTNIESAMIDSIGALQRNYVPRLVLITDGNETEGSAVRSGSELRSLNIPVDTIPLSTDSNVDFSLKKMSMPERAYANEQIPIDLTVGSAKNMAAKVEIDAEGRALGSSSIDLHQGVNQIRIYTRLKSSGSTLLSGHVSGFHGEVNLPFEGVVKLSKAKVLYISDDPAGADNNLLTAFTHADYDVRFNKHLSAPELSEDQLVVLNNQDLNNISATGKRSLAKYVEDGGGLLLIGGERQVYKDAKQMDALDRILPARLAPPKKPEGICVVLIIDKSSSMEGRKIDLARLSAIGVVNHLRPADTIGVLMFDNSFQWAVPLRHAENKPLIKQLISGITPDGGTQIAPALAEAYHQVLLSNAAYKHIVLLTDGISEEGDSIDVAKDAAQHEITISTVGLGQDVNRSYLERIAAKSGGKTYLLNEPQGLEQILLKDVMDYSGSTAVEKSLAPIVQNQAEILDGLDMQSAPALKGYVRFQSKPTAQTILSIDKRRKDPLYVRWQYGLGRVGVFTSDAKSRWAESWVTWRGFDKFWLNISHDLLSRTQYGEARADYDSANGELLVSFRLKPAMEPPTATPQLFVIGPEGYKASIDLQLAAPHLYKGRVHIGQRTGLFRVRPVNESKAFPEVSYFHGDEEKNSHGVNEALLRQISEITGGRFNPDLASIFSTGDRSTIRTWQLWPGLLALTIVLNVAELLVRKWGGLTAWFR